jgi:hypothetical protein
MCPKEGNSRRPKSNVARYAGWSATNYPRSSDHDPMTSRPRRKRTLAFMGPPLALITNKWFRASAA